MANWHLFEARQELVASLKAAIIEKLGTAVGQGRRASWAVSGGATPAPLFAAMQMVQLEWDKIDVALVDERWVPFDHARSNEAFVAGSLLGGNAAAAQLTGMKTEHTRAAEAVDDVNIRYAKIKQPFDSVLLGLGADGHTASLFPGALGLEAAFDADAKTCVALTALRSDVTGDEVERMSLSATAIADARHVALMITGDAKKQVLEAALAPASELPIGRLHKMRSFDVYWAP